jgi:hypothetical protein
MDQASAELTEKQKKKKKKKMKTKGNPGQFATLTTLSPRDVKKR